VVFQESVLSYETLNWRANQLADTLITRFHVEHGDRVGYTHARSENIIISIVAIFKGGGVYVPLDVESPPLIRRYPRRLSGQGR